jgi:soluble lytic murein transglycosylase
MREYPRAVEAFGALPQTDDIPIWYARSLARSDRVPEAIAKLEELGRDRRGAHALQARFLAALLLEGRGRIEEARRYLESLVQDGATVAVRQASLWRLAWQDYLEGRHAAAIASIDQLSELEKDPIGKLRCRYWRARSLERLAQSGDPTAAAAAQQELQSIALEYPLTYYGWRARLRLAGDVAGSEARAPGTELAPGRRRLLPGDLERARILLEAGLEARALDELARVSARAGGLADRLELAQLFRSAGHFPGAQRVVVDPYQLALARGPSPTLEDLWWHAWPAAYLDLVEAETRQPGSVDAALVLSIMREESGFHAAIVSPVGARGLLQIMEPTGRRLAEAVGQGDFDADDLFDPQTNIRLGSYYLKELSELFEGRLSAAIASYNAGPEAVSRWLEDGGELEDDEWVEAIPYDQTRDYVKRVLRSLQAYRLLY